MLGNAGGSGSEVVSLRGGQTGTWGNDSEKGPCAKEDQGAGDRPGQKGVAALGIALGILAVLVVAAGPVHGAPIETVGGGAPPAVSGGSASGLHSAPASQPTTELVVGADCEVGERFPEPGEPVSIDASGSVDADEFRYDRNNEGDYSTNWTTDQFHSFTYETEGSFTPRVAARNTSTDDVDEVECPTLEVAPNEAPTARATNKPTYPAVGETVTIDARNSSDPDGEIGLYQFDFGADGSYEVQENRDGLVNRTYSTAGTKQVRVRVEDDDSAEDTVLVEFTVGPVAECSVSPQTVSTGEAVTLDASASKNADSYQYAPSVDRGFGDITSESSTTVTYAEPGNYTPFVRVRSADGETRDDTTCPTVTVTDNEPPTSSFTISPRPAIADAQTTLDASGSSDPDGTIQYYLWDFDGSGTIDLNTTNPVIEHRFAYDTTAPGFAAVNLVVVDDDGARDGTVRDLEITRAELTAECGVDPSTTEPGDEVTIFVDAGPQVDTFQYDRDQTGEFGDVTTETSQALVYDEPGNYTPRVRVHNSTTDQSRIVDCTTVTVEEPNEPPLASGNPSPRSASPGQPITFNAAGSFDPDGTVVKLEWDFDNDGIVDATTHSPTENVTYTFPNEGTYSVGLTATDDDGATNATTLEVPVSSGPNIPDLFWWGLALLLGGVGGGAAIGHIPKHSLRRGSKGPRQYATGTFAAPSESGTVAVTGLGFEPDVIFLWTDNAVTTEGTWDRTLGRGFGAAVETDGGIDQWVVSVGDDAHAADATTGAVHRDKAIDVLVHGDEQVGSLAGAVTRTTGDGFEVDFDASTVPTGVDHPFVVLFQAIATGPDGAAAVGQVGAPDDAEGTTVDLGIDADYVTFGATDRAAGVDHADVSETGVAFSHGEAVRTTVGGNAGVDTARVVQRTVGSVVTPSTLDSDVRTVEEDVAIAFPDVDGAPGSETAGDEVAGSVRVTELGHRLGLDFEGERPPDVVPFVAMANGGAIPAIGQFEAPGPGECVTVDVGFRPANVTLSVVDPEHGAEGRPSADPLPYDWSDGAALHQGDGEVSAHVLSDAVDDPRLSATASKAVVPVDPQTGGATFTLRGDAVSGRRTVQVTAMTECGFKVEGSGVPSEQDDPARPLLLYTAWPDRSASREPTQPATGSEDSG